MSIATIKSGMERIRSAPWQSPIAVFKRDAGYRSDNRKSPLVEPGLCFSFARTAVVSAALRREDKSLVGIFDGSMDLVWVERRLRETAKLMHKR